MSDTTRTDGIEFHAQRGMMPPYNTVPSAFARELERELNAAHERIRRLEEAGDRMLGFYEEIGTSGYDQEAMTLWRKTKGTKT